MAESYLHTIKPVMESRMREVARRVVWQQSHFQMMQELGLSLRQLKYCMRQPMFQQLKDQLEEQLFAELDKRHKDELEQVRQKARKNAMNALDKIIDLMDAAPSASVQRDCANDVLDLAGVKSVQKVQAPSMVFTNAQIQMLHMAVQEDDRRKLAP